MFVAELIARGSEDDFRNWTQITRLLFEVGSYCGFKQLHSVGLIKDKW